MRRKSLPFNVGMGVFQADRTASECLGPGGHELGGSEE